MTEAELFECVEAALANHLDASYWSALDESVRRAAVSMAMFDVLAEIPGATLDSVESGSFIVQAIAEQAAYLARNYETMTDGRIATSETIESVSASYSFIGGDASNARLSFRAAAYIRKAKAAICGAALRVARG